MIRPLATLSTVFLLTVVAVFALLRIDRVVVARGCFTGGTVAVRAPLAGRVVQVAVEPGQRVLPGQILLRFDTAPLVAEIDLADARIADLERRHNDLAAEIARLATGIHPAEAEQSHREIERSRLARNNARATWERTRDLAAEGLVAEEELQESDLALRLAEIELASRIGAAPLLARRQAEAATILRQEMAAAEADLAEERLEQDERLRLRDLCTVTAPDSGMVVGPDLFELAQRYLDEGAELLRIERGAAARFEGWLDDHGRAKARRGQDVKIRLDGYPWLLHGSVPGRVEVVAGRREHGTDGRDGFPVVVSYMPGSCSGPLLDGMTGQARIVVGEQVTLGRLLMERMLGVDTP